MEFDSTAVSRFVPLSGNVALNYGSRTGMTRLTRTAGLSSPGLSGQRDVRLREFYEEPECGGIQLLLRELLECLLCRVAHLGTWIIQQFL